MRNNYADNDAQPVCKVVPIPNGNPILVEAADPDQFWAVDFLSVSGVSGPVNGLVRIQYSASANTNLVFDYYLTDEDQFVFPPLYRGNKNEPLYIVAPSGSKVSIRYR